MRLLDFICFSLCVSLSATFNLEPRIAVIKNGSPKTFFGFSVAQHQTLGAKNTSWIMVGAPIDDNLQPNTEFSGALYRCPLTTNRTDCIQVETDGFKANSAQLHPPLPVEEKPGQWLGVVVDSQGPGRKVLVCAHRYANRGLRDEYYHMDGLCYTLDQNLKFSNYFRPCAGLNKKGGHLQYGMCQAGVSGLITDDDMVLLGLPGAINWKGTVYAVNVSDDYLMRDKTNLYGPNSPETTPVEENSLNGMAVAYGRFFSPHGQHSFVSGAPRAGRTGQVVFYSKGARFERWLTVDLVLKGDLDFSNYGYSLCTLDLNSDGMTDLVVGAPHHYTASTGGAIYIYVTPRSGLKADTPFTRILGLPESQFGLGLSTAGDLNLDGFEDLAVGAPFEEGGGAVYIYFGSRQGIASDQRASQIVRARDVSGAGGLMSFGHALFGGQDLDGNNYPDLVVGAFCSDKVMLIRSRPIIAMETELRNAERLDDIDVSQIECDHNPASRQKCVGFESCFWLNSSRSSIPDASIEYHLEAETFDYSRKFSRVHFSQSSKDKTHVVEKKFKITSQMTEKFFCRQEYMYIKNGIGDIYSPIRFQISYKLLLPDPDQQQGFLLPDINKFPILDQNQATKVFEATFAKDCGADGLCQSEFGLAAVYDLPLDSEEVRVFEAGSIRQLFVNVSVNSQREPAYDAILHIEHPPDISFVGTRAQNGLSCSSKPNNALECLLGNPFNRGSRDFVLKFDVSSLPLLLRNKNGYNDRFLDLRLRVTTSSLLEVPVETNIRARVIQRSDIEISGVAKPEQTTYGSAESSADDEIDVQYVDQVGSPILHTYDVYNDGPLTAEFVEVEISWPYRLASGGDHVNNWLMYLTRTPFVQGNGECFVDDSDINPLQLKSRQSEPDLVVREKTEASSEKLNIHTSSLHHSSSSSFSGSSSSAARVVTASTINPPPQKTYKSTRKNSIEHQSRKVSSHTQQSSKTSDSSYRRKNTDRGRFRSRVSTVHRGSSGIRHGSQHEGVIDGEDRTGDGREIGRYTSSGSSFSTTEHYHSTSTDEHENSFVSVSASSSSSGSRYSSSYRRKNSQTSSSSGGGAAYRRYNSIDESVEDPPLLKSRRLYAWQRPRHTESDSADLLRKRRRKYRGRLREEEETEVSGEPDRGSRRRRSEPRAMESEVLQDDVGQAHTVVKIDCESGSALCLKIRCRINQLPAKRYALVHVQGRLSNSTLLKHFPHVTWVSVSSQASYSLPQGVRSRASSNSSHAHQVETRAYSQLAAESSGSVPVWAIVLAVLLGLLLLSLLVLLLWRLGFFQRRKPAPH